MEIITNDLIISLNCMVLFSCIFKALKAVLKEESSRNKCYYYHRDVPGNNHATCLDKTDTAKDCHDLCYYTKDCAQFIWFDKSFQNGQRYKDCCMKTIHSNYYVYAKGAISGGKYCDDTYDQGKRNFFFNPIKVALLILDR